MSKKLKFSLELNENGDLKIDIEGSGSQFSFENSISTCKISKVTLH